MKSHVQINKFLYIFLLFLIFYCFYIKNFSLSIREINFDTGSIKVVNKSFHDLDLKDYVITLEYQKNKSLLTENVIDYFSFNDTVLIKSGLEYSFNKPLQKEFDSFNIFVVHKKIDVLNSINNYVRTKENLFFVKILIFFILFFIFDFLGTFHVGYDIDSSYKEKIKKNLKPIIFFIRWIYNNKKIITLTLKILIFLPFLDEMGFDGRILGFLLKLLNF